MTKINVFTDNSTDSKRIAPLLEEGIQAVGGHTVQVKDIAHQPQTAAATDFSESHAKNLDIDLLLADAFLFSTTGALSVFEKHFFSNDPNDEKPLEGKLLGVVLSDKTTFDQGISHPLDNKLLDRLTAHGLQYAPIKVNGHSDEDLKHAGKLFGEAARELKG
ncbi:hypothetical protein K450DRAFT_238557 [Umbelopsis ramanniana AG]|uniref:Uncharacterized protein n=1 Tax=Umbelopsis ramanniana AG TaxID=1314678 RepID=A0AAD5HF10_UMBRA|nr:uncharacterized protein K450DRAFT_238557 [Umbelopsis ramanniana AG]KAI8580186.1 hypothetical protein K450DRAFT_238557 [Umbelopsis ramanniana AG]